MNSSPDKLPPHSLEAEQAVLGCILDTPLTGNNTNQLQTIREKFQQDEVFYDLRHQTIWHAIEYLVSEGKPVDLITLQQELKTRGQLDQIGGIDYLGQLQDTVPGSANLPYYLDIVWEQYVARRLIQINLRKNELVETGEITESLVARIDQEHKQWTSLLDRGAVSPKNLKTPGDFADEYMQQWFDRKDDTYGYSLPFEFPLRLRPGATTVMTGDNGSGKSTMLNWIAIHVMQQLQPGEKVCLASMEMPCATTLWMMARQILACGMLERDQDTERRVFEVLVWLNERVLLYDFLGITDRHELINTFEYAATRLNAKFFELDNLMKVGIADDDYAAQGQFIQRICDFNLARSTHTIVVVHENKGDGSAKQKVRGSKQITDAPDNVIGMKRNEDKASKLEELKAEHKAQTITTDEYNAKVNGMRLIWDSKFTLNKQRWPGAQQNGSKWLYFDKPSLRLVPQGESIRPLILKKHQNTEA